MIITSLLALAQTSAPAGDYHVEIRPQDGASAEVFITLRIEGDSDGETMLELPSSWGGEDELWRGFTGISVEGGTLQPAEPEAPTERVVAHQPGADLTIRWQIIQDREGTPPPRRAITTGPGCSPPMFTCWARRFSCAPNGTAVRCPVICL